MGGLPSTKRYSTASLMPAESWPFGATTTTMSGRIPRWATKRPQKRAGRSSNFTAPRPARLPHPKTTTINPKDSRYERGTTGRQVTPRIQTGPGRNHAGGPAGMNAPGRFPSGCDALVICQGRCRSVNDEPIVVLNQAPSYHEEVGTCQRQARIENREQHSRACS